MVSTSGVVDTKARDIYLSLVSKGWASTLADLTPTTMVPLKSAKPTKDEKMGSTKRSIRLSTRRNAGVRLNSKRDAPMQ